MLGLSKNDWKCIGIGWVVLLAIASVGFGIFALVLRYSDSTEQAVDIFVAGIFIAIIGSLSLFLLSIAAGAIGSVILSKNKKKRRR